jgi:hypothetical protein
MKWEGFSNWPPVWTGLSGRGDIFSGDEDGILTGVQMVEANSTTPRHLILGREHRGRISGARLHCDDEGVIPHLVKILEGCVGWSISRIGDLDVDLCSRSRHKRVPPPTGLGAGADPSRSRTRLNRASQRSRPATTRRMDELLKT